MEISKESWQAYVDLLASVNQKAGKLMQSYIDQHGYDDVKNLIETAYQISSAYGEANGSIACQMYDEIARIQGAHVPNAEMAETPKYGEVAKAVQGTMLNKNSTVPGTVERLTKQVGADTMIKNAKRDGAQWAWIPGGSETCAFCITLASQGWKNASEAQLRGNHASHIHAHCKCEFAIRFDGKSEVEGYDPKKYYDMYMNASDSKSSVKKINALRRKLNNQEDSKKIQGKASNADFMGKKEKMTIKTPKGVKPLIAYKVTGIENIYTQTYSKDAQDMIAYLDKAINGDNKYGKLDKIIIAQQKSLNGFAAYDHKANSLYVSEELINEDKFKDLVDFDYFPSRSLQDVLTHEMTHKAHWDAAKKYHSANGIKEIDDAKMNLESDLRKYVISQTQNDEVYIRKYISENAYFNFKMNKSLNELIADGRVLLEKGELQDNYLGDLIREVINYDG